MFRLSYKVVHSSAWVVVSLLTALVPLHVCAEWKWIGLDNKLGVERSMSAGSSWYSVYSTDVPSLAGDIKSGLSAAWAEFNDGSSWGVGFHSCKITTSELSGDVWIKGSAFSECSSNITTSPVMTVDKEGVIASAWTDNGIYVSDKSKGEWGAANRLSQSNDFKPQLAAQEKGGLTVIWRRDYGNDISAIMAKQKLSGVWQDELMLSELGVRATDPRLVGISENKLVATWVEVSKDKYVIQSSIFDGLNWGQAKPISLPSSTPIAQLGIRQTSSGVFVVWGKPDDYGNTVIEVSAFDGSDWSILEASPSYKMLKPVASIAKDGAIDVAWINDVDKSNLSLQSIGYKNTGWTSLQIIEQPLSSVAENIGISGGENGNALVVYTNNGAYRSAYKINEAWSEPFDFAEKSNGKIASLYVDDLGNGLVIWSANYEYDYSPSYYFTKKGTFNPMRLMLMKYGKGNISGLPEGDSCDADCLSGEYFYFKGDLANLSAIPVEGYEFNGWTGDCVDLKECRLKLDEDKQVVATFKVLPKYRLSIVISGRGSVNSKPDAIYCNPKCKGAFYKGADVELSATPRDGFYLKEWVGCASVTGGVCSVTMSKPTMTVKPIFKKLPKYKLSIAKTKYGSVASSPAGLKCGPNVRKCSAAFTSGTEVTLTLKPVPGHTYTGWSGACEGVTADTCTVKMDGPKSVGASFQ